MHRLPAAPFVFETCCPNIDSCANVGGDESCASAIAGGTFTCDETFCATCGASAGFCDIACGFCTPETGSTDTEGGLACKDSSPECGYLTSSLGCSSFVAGGHMAGLCDLSCSLCRQGDEACFDGADFTYTRCCDTTVSAEGDAACWDGADFAFGRCCATDVEAAPPPPTLACNNAFDEVTEHAGFCDMQIASGVSCAEAFCPACDNRNKCDLACGYCGEGQSIAVAPPPPSSDVPPPPPEETPCVDLNSECSQLVGMFGCDRSLEPVVSGTGADICPSTCGACQGGATASPPPPPPDACPPIADMFTDDDHVLHSMLSRCATDIGTTCMVGCDALGGYVMASGLLGAPMVCGVRPKRSCFCESRVACLGSWSGGSLCCRRMGSGAGRWCASHASKADADR